jgi:hypothetical protein
MLHTFEARFAASLALDALLSENAQHWSWGLRKAWSFLYRQRLSRAQAYAELKELEFTSKQVESLLTAAEMKHAGLVEASKYQLRQLELAIRKREQALAEKRKKIHALEKRQAALRKRRDAFAPKPEKQRTKRFLKALATLRDVDAELAFCRNWVRQKARVLQDKRGRLERQRADLSADRLSLCFGSKRLLAHRPSAHNGDTTPFDSLADWRAAWAEAREGQWWSVGHTDKPSGNSEVQWLPQTRQLRIRLTDKVAHRLMDERGVPRSGTQQKFMPLRMACRFVTLDGVDFVSHKGAARAALLDAFGRRPVTMRVLYRLQPDGSRAWYVQASLEVPAGFQPEAAASREAGVLGLDFNARGVAWCAVKPDGNRLRDQHGFLPWNLKGRTSQERQQEIGTVVAQLTRHAKRLKLPLAIEALDFATKKTAARAGVVNKRFNDMLGALPSAQFAQMAQRACEKQHLKLYSVNPLYSSVGGFTKYGRPNRMNADTSAALWLGRQALYGEVCKAEGAVCHVGIHDERLVFSHLPTTPMQSMTALAGAQWRDVAWGLGSNRRRWGAKFRSWVASRVEAASRSGPPGPEQPDLALAPAG